MKFHAVPVRKCRKIQLHDAKASWDRSHLLTKIQIHCENGKEIKLIQWYPRRLWKIDHFNSWHNLRILKFQFY